MNILHATLTSITATDHLSSISVSVGRDIFHILLAQPFHDPIGSPLTITFKETEVILALSATLCTANGAYGTVRDIRQGAVLSEVTFDYEGIQLKALVPTLTFAPMGISIGMEIAWAVQPSEISLMRENHGS